MPGDASPPAVTAVQASQIYELRRRLSDDPAIERHLIESRQGGLSDQTLLRWLRADGFKLDVTEKRLREHSSWRASFVPGGCIREESISGELGDPHQAFLQGHDNDGRPVLVVVAGRRDKATRDYKQVARYVTYAMDAAVEAMGQQSPDGKVVAIVDMREITFSKLDPQLRRTIYDILSNHYPERLSRIYMFDTPYYISTVWWLLSPFVDEVTREKFQFVSGEAAHQKFLSHIPAEVLPKDYGGEAELVPVEDHVRRARQKGKSGMVFPNGVV